MLAYWDDLQRPWQVPAESCLAAVSECDFFFGIIFPFYGSGITHDEFREAIACNVPRGFLVHRDVTFAGELLKQFMFDENKKRTAFKLGKKTIVIDDLRIIKMYNDAIGDGLPMEKRLWAQEFFKYGLDGAPFVETQFANETRFRADLEKLKGGGIGK